MLPPDNVLFAIAPIFTKELAIFLNLGSLLNIVDVSCLVNAIFSGVSNFEALSKNNIKF